MHIWHMQASQVPIETRHCNLILKQSVKSGNIRSAERNIADMLSGQLAPPNAASFECLAEVMLHTLICNTPGHLLLDTQ